ncbi:MAG TPA: hypothetical protein DCE41_36375 [Cytophagales bacterium]|nr:hypothetical protein [Cytophagales bacterium]
MNAGKRRVVHSLWTKPMAYNRWFIEGQLDASIWLYALSYLYAKEVADEVILHTDDRGQEILSLIPYDEVLPTLNSLDQVHQKWWAMGKVAALEAEPLGSVHIDGDVFLRDPKAIAGLLFDEEHDLVCQMIEQGHLFTGGYVPQLPHFDHALRNVEVPGYGLGKKAFNCGVIGFHNAELRKQFLANTKMMVAECTQDDFIMQKLDGQYEPNIIVEQYMLAGLVELMDAKVRYILDPEEVHQQRSLNKVANALGYTHIWGKTKYDPEILGIVQEIIKRKDPALYQRLSESLRVSKGATSKDGLKGRKPKIPKGVAPARKTG